MKILIIHNRYQQRGGEDAIVDQEYELLMQTEEVKMLTFQNLSGWRGAFQFFSAIWNIASASEIKKAVDKFKPDVVHLHNWHYAIGPLAIRIVYKKKIPIVLTVHNFRLLCPSATLFYKGSVFLDSLYSSYPWKAIQKKVYRNSLIQTFWLATIVWIHKKLGTWKMVDRYILLTELARSLFISSSLGTRETQFSIKPNFVLEPEKSVVKREEYFLYVGRLASEKGVYSLLQAFIHKKNNLYIAGDGPYKEMVLKACRQNPNIQYLGLLDKDAVQKKMRFCSALIFPSIWFEGMPMTLIEAFSVGTAVIGSNLGAMSTMIKDGYNGLHFSAGNPEELYEKITYWVNMDKLKKVQISENARREYELFYTPERNKIQLVLIYNSVIENRSVQ